MNNLIIHKEAIDKILPHRDRGLLKYSIKYPKRFETLEQLLKDGELSQSQCCKYSGFPSTQYFLIMKYGEMLLNFFEDQDIDYTNTEYYNIIRNYILLDKAYIDGQVKGMKVISEAAKDRIATDENGKEFLVKKGDWKAQAFLLKYSRKNEFSDIQEDGSSSQAGVTINIDIPKSFNLDEIALMSQKNLINQAKGE
jgi:hypothetical protein